MGLPSVIVLLSWVQVLLRTTLLTGQLVHALFLGVWLDSQTEVQTPSTVSACNCSKDDDWLVVGGTNGSSRLSSSQTHATGTRAPTRGLLGISRWFEG